ncbi:MAG: efflux RND transporter periplasmic adaptor subunit [Acidobacteriota bacterium]|nr:efflux RND transporter periplasmic adaptor subunit [Acidobacteriota bacterium]
MSTDEQNAKGMGQASHATERRPGQQHSGAASPPGISRGVVATLVVVLLAIAVAIGVAGVLRRVHATSDLEHYTDANAAPPVALEMPVMETTAQEIVIPGNVQAFSMAPIYARTAGYVKAWYRDIGAHVHKGELLALIQTPELDQQLSQARADLATAQANAGLAKVTADRYQDLVSKNAVSQQDTDNAASALRARTTAVASAEANVHRLEELQSFERITAPFDGVITARNIDIGQLISASGSTDAPGGGSQGSSSKEIFDIAAITTLRVFINVPQVHAPDAKNGTPATLTLPQYPGRTFEGKLVRSSDAVDPATRTLLAEVEVDNRSGELLPGSYTEVHLHTKNRAPALVVPISAVILQPDGLHVAVVDGDQIAHLVRVTPGRDFGATMEILSGLKPGQEVISNPPDSLTDGEPVHVVSHGGGGPGENAGGEQKR